MPHAPPSTLAAGPPSYDLVEGMIRVCEAHGGASRVGLPNLRKPQSLPATQMTSTALCQTNVSTT